MTLIWSRPARRDIFAIAEHYGLIDPDLPLHLLTRIQEAPLVLLEYPHLGSLTRRRGIRKWSVRGTPFILLYAAGPARVEIRRVIHSAMNWSRD